MLSAGIVGLPNVGKSTLFNAVTRTRNAEAANYPFCTIEPNKGVVSVPDPRLDALAKLSNSARMIPAAIEFVDIAGLVQGASEGEGLGNQFLSHIREVDAIVQVVRCFENNDIHHVSGLVDPTRDIEVVNTELILADLASVQKRSERLQKQVRAGDKQAKAETALLERLIPHLNDGKPAITLEHQPGGTDFVAIILFADGKTDDFCLQCCGIGSRRDFGRWRRQRGSQACRGSIQLRSHPSGDRGGGDQCAN